MSGRESEAKGVGKARVEELIEVAKHRVYDKVPRTLEPLLSGRGGWTLTKEMSTTLNTGVDWWRWKLRKTTEKIYSPQHHP